MARTKRTERRRDGRTVQGIDSQGRVRRPTSSHANTQVLQWTKEQMEAAVAEFFRQKQPGFHGMKNGSEIGSVVGSENVKKDMGGFTVHTRFSFFR